MKILVMGGTRFVGKAIVKTLKEQSHDIYLFTRGNKPIPEHVNHIKGDRKTESINKLKGLNFDVIIDSSGREAKETERLLEVTGNPNHRFIYISSAGVYKKTSQYPIGEDSPIDLKSRHYGKAETEQMLIDRGLSFTSFRPTYIYGAGNYNPIEKWFFDRIMNNKKVPMPDDGKIITQLGHVNDLARAIILALKSNQAENKIYNCSGNNGITIEGLIRLAYKVCGKSEDDYKIKSFDSSFLDPKARKLFPIRLDHFLTDISLIKKDLEWEPKYNLFDGLTDSFINDYKINYIGGQVDYASDSVLLY